MTSWIGKISQRLFAFALFIRFSAMSFSVILPLLGAATGLAKLTSYQLVGLVGIAVTFHIFAYVLNDVIDLPIDRTETLRTDYPLVRGAIQVWQASTVALAQIPLALALTYWMQASSMAYVALGFAFTAMAIYDLWGKRTSFPPLTDLIQGLGWGALILYGAAVVSYTPNAVTGVLFFFVIVFIMLINGVHGALRDIENDLNHGVCTTAILLGARPRARGIVIPFRLAFYALTLQALLTGIIFLPIAYNWFGYGPATWIITMVVVTIFLLLSFLLLVVCATLTVDRPRMISLGTLHIVTSLACLLLLFIPYLDSRLLTVVLVTYTAPLCRPGRIRKWFKSVNRLRRVFSSS